MKKLVIVGPSNSTHTLKWLNSLCDKYIVYLFTIHNPLNGYDKRIKIIKFAYYRGLGYLINSLRLKKAVKIIQPDVVNVYYASGYGAMSLLVTDYPKMVSVWGSDIYDFPKKSIIHKYIIKLVLNSSTGIASTSKVMSDEIKLYTNSKVYLTPFGVDNHIFDFRLSNSTTCKSNVVNIGCVKSLKPIYNINVLIQVVCSLVNVYNVKNVHLYIVGDGPEFDNLSLLVKKLNLIEYVTFTGFVDNNNTVNYYKLFDIYCALSERESFGVSLLEAFSFKLPVVCSNADGFLEIVDKDINAYVHSPSDIEGLAASFYYLINNKEARLQLGSLGYEKFIKNYTTELCLTKMITALESVQRDDK